MNRSISLLDRALKDHAHGELANAIGVSSGALSTCKKMGQLTPVIAGNLAAFLNENVEAWVTIAAVESVRECPAKLRLMRHLDDRLKSCF